MIVLCLLWTALASPTVAIADLANHTGDPAFDGAGPGVAGVLVSRFQGSGVVDVVERGALEAILAEQQLGVGGLADARTAAKAGRIAGADFVVMGELFSVKLPSLSIALRVVDTESGAVVLAKDVVGDIGADGERFFELLDTLTDTILEAMQVDLRADRPLSSIEKRELEMVLRYGEGLMRVNLDHPMSLYREPAGGLPEGASYTVVTRRGEGVEMPELARRVGDRDAQGAFLARQRKARRQTKTHDAIAISTTLVGLGLVAVGAAAPDDAGVALPVGVGVAGVGATHFTINLVAGARRKKALREPDTYYTAEEADQWIRRYNASLVDP